MAIRVIYSLLVNDEPVTCCQHRRDILMKIPATKQMSYIAQDVNIYDLAKCDSCGMPCLFRKE